jgi:hypothetical protein
MTYVCSSVAREFKKKNSFYQLMKSRGATLILYGSCNASNESLTKPKIILLYFLLTEKKKKNYNYNMCYTYFLSFNGDVVPNRMVTCLNMLEKKL